MKRVVISLSLALAVASLVLVPFSQGVWAAICFLGSLASATILVFSQENRKNDAEIKELKDKMHQFARRQETLELRTGLTPKR